MADYYVDYTASATGSGTVANPWNQFTSDESATVSGGDNIWFRRTTIDTYSTFSWIGGDSNTNRVNYIGWPSEGDVYYEQREESLQDTWDNDATTYFKITGSLSSADESTGTVVPSTNTDIHRFYIQNTSNNYRYYMHGVTIYDVANISFFNSYMYNTTISYRTWHYGVLYLQSSSNIKFIDSVINGAGGSASSYNGTLNVQYCNNIIFEGCTLYWGNNNSSTAYFEYLDSTDTSYIDQSDITFNNCDFYMRMYSDMSSDSGYYSCGYTYFNENSECTISGSNVYITNENSSSSYGLDYYAPLAAFKVQDSTFNVYDTYIQCVQGRSSFLLTIDDTDIYMKNVTWDVTSTNYKTVFIDNRGYKSLYLKNIYGNSPQGGTDPFFDKNYFMSFKLWEDILDIENTQLENVSSNLGNILDTSRDADTQDLIITDTVYPLLNHSPIDVFRLGNIIATNTSFAGFVLDYKEEAAGYVYGDNTTGAVYTFKDCTFSDIPIMVQMSNNVGVYNITLQNCTGEGTVIVDSDENSGLNIDAYRNIGFTGFGSIGNNYKNSYTSALNSFDNGTTTHVGHGVTYKTSTANRTGGAGYSIEITRQNYAEDMEVACPKFGAESYWVYFPSDGTYNVEGYLLCTTTSGSITSSDVRIGIDVTSANSYTTYSDTFEEDSSVWSETLNNQQAIKLTINDLTVSQAQYCPVRLYISGNYDGQIIYLDPQFEASSVS